MARPRHLPPEPVETEKDGVKLVSLGDTVATIYRCNNNGYPQYRVSCRAGLKRLRLTRSDEKEAIEEAKRMVKSVAAGKVDLASTPLREIEEWTALKEEAGGDLRLLRTALEEYRRRNPDDLRNRTAREVVDEFIENRKLRRERRKRTGKARYIETLRSRLGKFADTFPKKIHEITTEQIDNFLHGNPDWSPRTVYNMEGDLRTLYAFAKWKGYLGKAETAIDSLESLPKPASDPKVLTPDQLMQVFQHVTARNRKLVPFIALGAFGGIRAAEIMRMNWEEHIDLEERSIQLPSSVTKTNRRRVVPISDTLAVWLQSCPQRNGRVVDLSNPNRSLQIALKGSNIEWPHNGLRHGFVSYEMARTGDASKTAEICGHSVAMLQTNYKQLVKRAEAERWFSITPELVKNGWPDKCDDNAREQDVTPESATLARAS